MFYLALALLSWAGAYRARWPIWLLAVLSLGIVFCGWYMFSGPYQKAASCLPVAFFIGNLTFLYREQFKKLSAWWSMPLFILSSVTELNGFRPAATILISIAVLLLGVNYRPRIGSFPDFSYGAYVYHLPLTMRFGTGLNWLAMLIITCLSSWFFLEKPFLKLKRWRYKEPNNEAVQIDSQKLGAT